jgi:hypothetical protein
MLELRGGYEVFDEGSNGGVLQHRLLGMELRDVAKSKFLDDGYWTFVTSLCVSKSAKTLYAARTQQSFMVQTWLFWSDRPSVPRTCNIFRDILCAMRYCKLANLRHPSKAHDYSLFAQLAVGHSMQLEIYNLWSFTDST